MKSIQSAGGPLIGLNEDQFSCWSGVFGKGFVGEESQFVTDYDAVRYFAHGGHKPPRAVALLGDQVLSPPLITMPFETAIIEENKYHIYIAQVEYADPEWNFESVSVHCFEGEIFDGSERVSFSCTNGIYRIFDAAYSAYDVGGDCIRFEIDAGDYVFSAVDYKTDERTGLILYKIQRA